MAFKAENEDSMDHMHKEETEDSMMSMDIHKAEIDDSMDMHKAETEDSMDMHNYASTAYDKDTEDFIENLNECEEAAHLIWKSEKLLYDQGIVSGDNKSLQQLEKILLDMAATPSLCLGLLYILMFKVGDCDMIRFMEAGNYVGFVHKKAELFGTRDVVKPLEVYNQYDIKKRNRVYRMKPKKSDRKRSNKQRYKELLGVAQKHLGIMEPTFLPSGIVKYLFVCTVREHPSADDRYLKCWKQEKMYPDAKAMKDLLHEHILSGQNFHENSIYNLSPLPTHDENCFFSSWEQFEYLSKISNYHWWPYTRLDGKKSVASLSVGLIEHLSYSPFPVCADGTIAKVRKYLPVSPRNRMIYFLMNLPDKLIALVRNVFIEWEKERDSVEEPIPESAILQVGQAKKRKYQKSFASLTDSQLGENISEDKILSMYENFEEFLLSSIGTILWRHHSPIRNVFLLNDFEMLSGDSTPNSYVHITVTEGEQDWEIQCICKMYDFQQMERQRKSTKEMNQSVTCMHCRFVRSNLIGGFNNFEDIQNTSAAVKMKKMSCTGFTPARNQAVVLLGNMYKKGCTKYSVMPDSEHCEFVHINKGVARCQGKLCVVNNEVKKKISELVDFEESEDSKVCEHLKTMSEHHLVWEELLDEKPQVAVVNGKEEQGKVMHFDHNQPSPADESVFFDDTEAKNSGGRSTHTPKPMYDQELISATHSRLSLFANSLQRNKYGHLVIPSKEGQMEPLKFYQKPVTFQCKCGAGYFSDASCCYGCDLSTCSCWNNLEGDIACILYTRYGSVSCEVYKRHCLQRSPACELLYTGQGHCLHFLSHKTVMGDEMGWDFCTEAKYYKMSFSGFCEKMTRQYKTLGTTAAPFMSKGTFMKWFLSWESKLEADVKKGVDPYANNRKKSTKPNRKSLEETIFKLKKIANEDLEEM